MSILRKLQILLGFGMILFDPASLFAQEGSVGTLFIQNNGRTVATIYVNGAKQGYVSPGDARYALSEGFVTPDSGWQRDGTLKQTHAYGGWELKSPYEVEIITFSAPFTVSTDTKLTVAGDVEHRAYVWFGEKDAGVEPSPLIWENAGKIADGGFRGLRPIVQIPNLDGTYPPPAFPPLVAKTKGERKQTGIVGFWSNGLLGNDKKTYEFFANGTFKSYYYSIGEATGGDGNMNERGTWRATSEGISLSYQGAPDYEIITKFADGELLFKKGPSGIRRQH